MKVAIAGATGAVGADLIGLLEKRNFPVSELRLLASARSVGKTLTFKGQEIKVAELTHNSFKGIDLALFSAGAGRSLEFAPSAVKAGAVVVDNSSAFRMESSIPLVVPEVNPEEAFKHNGIIANPNCTTIQMVVALNPLHLAAGIKRIVVSTYQSVSGTGAMAIEELKTQVHDYVAGNPLKHEIYPYEIAFNVIPHVDVFLENGYTKEEMKMVHETRKIMSAPNVKVSATCVRVPVFRAHSESIQIETERKLSVEEARAILEKAPGVEVFDRREPGGYPTPKEISGSYLTYVGRLREDISTENGLAMWVVADQLLKGAALNALQIAELLLTRPKGQGGLA
ncbi:MAG: aspartate-semialdehyde dehydrogenase [Candidatus Lambdaproteobacteria bacterium RIFOXYD2_FULL_50_16]|uniref:Aspartate-semialdehyde dehydrogenase n=1 Tax=Candidatus Lambdaproteobacteria bacterium RIFOXYD2_FULL_50_16 TaxID=1817772 RepID=A0A1F6GB01_9PROT|nr:MAG: aspartate-semialdehyde dehydrogenase [Candidatus Lambdaproteobacteria bacterium RIFOXYD2_FULL_50_16]